MSFYKEHIGNILSTNLHFQINILLPKNTYSMNRHYKPRGCQIRN